MKQKYTQITNLLEQFVNKKMSGTVFETRYMALWKEMSDAKVRVPKNIQEVLDDIFCDCDEFCEDNKLFNPVEDIDEKEFRKRAQKKMILLKN